MDRDHDWHGFNELAGLEVRRIDDYYEVRQVELPHDVRTLSAHEWDALRQRAGDAPVPAPMSSNPNPSYITEAMWQLWEASLACIPGVELGGIYANKSCYHNTVWANQNSWPGAYCVQLVLDTNYGPGDKARAIDLTMSDIEMRTRTTYLKESAEHPLDDRLSGIREFIGTLDSSNVFCMIKDDDDVGNWSYDHGRDSSHLWHIHISVFTKHCATWDRDLEALASVLSGESWEQWCATKGMGDEMRVMLVRFHDAEDPSLVWYCDGMYRRRVEGDWWGNGAGPITNAQVHQASLLGNLVTGTPGDGSPGQWDSTGTVYTSGGDMDVWGIDVGSLSLVDGGGEFVVGDHTHETGPAIPA